MKKIISSFICITLGFSACQKSKPIVFNETIVEVNDIVTDAMFKFDAQTDAMTDSGNMDQINVLADSVLNVIDGQLKKVESLEIPSHGEEYKKAAIEFIGSTQKAIEYKKIYSQTPKEQLDSLRNEYATLFNELPICSEKLKEAQKLFAKSAKLELK